MLQTFSPADWIENFRISHETFNYLCQQLRPVIEKLNTRLRCSLSVEKRVGVTLWYLATPMEFRSIEHLFGIARCTACVIVHDTCKAIVEVLMKLYIVFPEGERISDTVDGFLKTWGIPQCCGAVDGSHIPISAPVMNHTDYYNRKGFYSVVVQAVVDYRYRFMNVYTGWPGSVHDARVFAHSTLYNLGTSNKLSPNTTKVIEGTEVPLYIVGDSAYPLLTWLMKPFPHNSYLSQEQRQYNYRISRARIVVENCFGRLKARWHRLLKRLDADVDHIPNIITASCVLHNICEVHGETFMNSWMDDIPNSMEEPHSNPTADTTDTVLHDAKIIQSALVKHFSR